MSTVFVFPAIGREAANALLALPLVRSRARAVPDAPDARTDGLYPSGPRSHRRLRAVKPSGIEGAK